MRIDALNHALEGLPQERIRYHICWGSWNAPHVHDVPLKDIVDLLLKLRVGGYQFEAANVRHEHEWKVWQDVKVPDDRILIPGVISHVTNVVEHPELVAERFDPFLPGIVKAASASWAVRIADLHRAPSPAGCIPLFNGRSSERKPKAPESRAHNYGARRRQLQV